MILKKFDLWVATVGGCWGSFHVAGVQLSPHRREKEKLQAEERGTTTCGRDAGGTPSAEDNWV